MRAILKSMWNYNIESLKEFKPENPRNFSLKFILNIEIEEQEGVYEFTIDVCTPSILEGMLRYGDDNALWGRHMLIVLEYDFELIEKKINAYLSLCTGESYLDVMRKISQIAAWEYGADL